MDLTLFFQRLVDGIASGAIYGALALALVLIFRSTGLLNFAQGEMAMFATFLTWYLADIGLSVWLAVLGSMVVALVGGAAIERVLIRPVEGASPLAIVIVSIGLFIALNALAGYLFGYDGRPIADLFPSRVFDVGGVRFSSETIGVLAVLLAVCMVLFVIFLRTKVGLALRAVASNPESSSLVGISVGRMLMLGWGMAGALGALAGALLTTKIFIEPNMMLGVLVYAFAAATLGGLDSPPGAVVGGLIVGVAESLAGGYIDWIGSDLKLAVALALILLILLVRPSGLFGSKEIARV
jgi:branched-chain amino acid transport system permease protein